MAVNKILKIERNPLDDKVQMDIELSVDDKNIQLLCEGVYAVIKFYLSNKKSSPRKERVIGHVKVIILNLMMLRELNGISYVTYSRDNNYYTKKRYNKLNIKAHYLALIVDAMAEVNFVEHHKGFYFVNDAFYGKRRSKIRSTPKLSIALSSCGVRYDSSWHIPESEVIILRNKNGDDVDYRDSQAICRMRRRLQQYNDLLRKTSITYLGKPMLRKRLKRIFNGSWRKGGRYYYGDWQSYSDSTSQNKKHYRNNIMIDGERVVELDYKSLHPSILYALEGMSPPIDCYCINDFDEKIVKIVFLILLNSNSYDQAKQAILDKIRKGKILFQFGMDADSLINLVVERMSPIRKYLFSSISLRLQCYDSQICERVLHHFTSKNIAVLPVHDSFIVEEKYENELKEVMMVEFKRQFGFDARIERKY